jgi:hypothetical protein
MSDDPDFAMSALWSHDMNGALETIEVMRDAVLQNLNRLVVTVSARLALCAPMLVKAPALRSN